MDSPSSEEMSDAAEEWEEEQDVAAPGCALPELQTAPALLPELQNKLQGEVDIPLNVLTQVGVPPLPCRPRCRPGERRPPTERGSGRNQVAPTLRYAAGGVVSTTCYCPVAWVVATRRPPRGAPRVGEGGALDSRVNVRSYRLRVALPLSLTHTRRTHLPPTFLSPLGGGRHGDH